MNDWYGSKPLIGVVGCPPLPGSGMYGGMDRNRFIDSIIWEAEVLEHGGFDGLMLQNIGDLPVPKAARTETIAWMSALGAMIRGRVSIPLGISLLEDDPEAILAAAHAAGASFVRIKVYVGAMVGPDGIVEGCAARVQRYRRELMAGNIAVFADVYDRTRWPLGGASLEEMAHEAVWFGKADGLVIAGRSVEQSFDYIRRVKQTVGVPVWIGGGVDADNVLEVLQAADGAIVGTSIKKDGQLLQPFDPNRVKAMAERKRMLQS
ncbi:BtpA/SgcQ family protein [Paenibacillus humicola]|uniref:BtpA/SgcQ family protein n=1 Tax=Paenibacillus humicola TaxID=3110540 RepID=UPI00237B1AEE|nr:BtpA/SgcQ family protein [Paenibacillus humicola]